MTGAFSLHVGGWWLKKWDFLAQIDVLYSKKNPCSLEFPCAIYGLLPAHSFSCVKLLLISYSVCMIVAAEGVGIEVELEGSDD